MYFPNNNNKKETPDQYDHIHMYSKSELHSSYLSMQMRLQNKIRREKFIQNHL